jgi:protein-disulfide isomerase
MGAACCKIALRSPPDALQGFAYSQHTTVVCRGEGLNKYQAAEAAESAGVQGKFWEMHYVLFEHQYALEPNDLLQYAAALGLDGARFSSELARHIHAPRVREHFMSGVRSGVNGTPTFFIMMAPTTSIP